MIYGELFAGIGGMSLGLERAGMTPAWFAENDPYCSRVLAKHWPHVPNLGDVTKIEWEKVESVDLVCGGFPCQPFSTAGLRLGADDPRYLWPQVVRAVGVLRPRFLLLENVSGLVVSPGFGRILGDLHELGFDAEWDCIPAAAVGAPHLRYRVFIVAYTARERGQDGTRFSGSPALVGAVVGANGRGESWDSSAGSSLLRSSATAGQADVADPDDSRSRQRCSAQDGRSIFGRSGPFEFGQSNNWAVEPDVGRVANGVPARVDRLKGLGNAVVPQVAEWIGRRILESAVS